MGAPGYTDDERRSGMRMMLVEGLFTRGMESFTGGVVLAAFALALGATNFEIGLLAAIPFLAQLSHIPAIALLGRYRDRKPLCVVGAAVSRALFFVVALLPFMSLPLRPVHALVPLLLANAVIATLSGASWQVWVRELVPRDRLGRYFGRRLMWLSVVGLGTLLLAGQFIAWVQSTHPDRAMTAFAALFVAGGLLGWASVAFQLRAPSRPSPPPSQASFRESLRRPLRDANYRGVLIFLGGWGFAANIALPFVSVLLLRTLGYGLGIVAGLAALSQLANVVGFRLWGPMTDRFGNKPVLAISATVFVAGMLAWTLLPKTVSTTFLLAAAAVHVVWGFAIAGLEVAGNGIVMKLAPEDEIPSYLATASVVKALAAGIGPLLGGVLATILAGRAFSLRFAWSSDTGERVFTALTLGPLDFLFLASFIMGLYSIHRLLGFQEDGEESPETVMLAIRREVTGPATVAGMRNFTHVASYVIEAAYHFERRLDPRRRQPPSPPPEEAP